MSDSYQYPVHVYSLSQFSEEIKGIAAAKCSRSANTFLQDAQELTDQKAADLYEKIVVGYGHNSVADMAMGSLCFEGISTLAAETLFDEQTGKFQAKSSRYVKFSRDRVINPFVSKDMMTIYDTGINALFDAYEGLHDRVATWVSAQPNMLEKPKSVINARVFDALRYLLPLSCLTNVGTRLSARDTAHLVRVLYASPMAEYHDLANKIRAAAVLETPTLLRHADPNAMQNRLSQLMCAAPRSPQGKKNYLGVGIWKGTPKGHRVTVVMDALAFELGLDPEVGFSECVAAFLSYTEQRKTRHDPLPHAMRSVRYTFSVQSDFGAWKDLRRHRRCELFRPEVFTGGLGFTIPEDIQAIGGDVLLEYTNALLIATEQWAKLNEFSPFYAQYLVAHGHIQSWRIDMDLEQLYFIGELRTEPFGHISYRRIAAQMVELAREYDPILFSHILVHPVEGVEAHH